MVKLDGGRVLEDVPPPEVGLVVCLGICRVEELVRGRCKAPTHERELVVEKTGIQSSNEGTCMLSACGRVGINASHTRHCCEED